MYSVYVPRPSPPMTHQLHSTSDIDFLMNSLNTASPHLIDAKFSIDRTPPGYYNPEAAIYGAYGADGVYGNESNDYKSGLPNMDNKEQVLKISYLARPEYQEKVKSILESLVNTAGERNQYLQPYLIEEAVSGKLVHYELNESAEKAYQLLNKLDPQLKRLQIVYSDKTTVNLKFLTKTTSDKALISMTGTDKMSRVTLKITTDKVAENRNNILALLMLASQ